MSQTATQKKRQKPISRDKARLINKLRIEVIQELPLHLASLNGQLEHTLDMPAVDFSAALAARRKPLSKAEIAKRMAAENTRQN